MENTNFDPKDSIQEEGTTEALWTTINTTTIDFALSRFTENQENLVLTYQPTTTATEPSAAKLLRRSDAKYAPQLQTLKSISLTDKSFDLTYLADFFTNGERGVEIMLKLFDPALYKATCPVQQYAVIKAAQDGNKFKALPNPASKYFDKPIVTKYVPARSNLSEDLINFKSSELLTIFPEAEASLFELAVGRGLYGINGDKFADNTEALKSPWRYLTLVCGAPGIGKSILMSAVQKAVENLGYTTAEFTDLNKQFGLEQIINKDFALSDDLRATTLKALLDSNSFKSIVSGAKVRTEEKFKSESEIQSRAALICNINSFPSSLLYLNDEGALNRIRVLQCKSQAEIAESDKTYFKILELKKKYKCSEQELFNAFFRNCVNSYTKCLETCTLKERVEELTIQLRYTIPTNVHQSFVELLQIASITANPERTIIPNLSGSSFRDSIKDLVWFASSADCHEARNLLKANWELHSRSSEHCWLTFRALDLPSLAESAMLAETLQDSQCGNLNRVLKDLLNSVRFIDGFKVSAMQDALSAAYSDAKFGLRNKYKPLIEQLEDLKIEFKYESPLRLLKSTYNRKAEFLALNSVPLK
jgi:hypothetical protein